MAGARIMNGARDKGNVRETRGAVLSAAAALCLCLPAGPLLAQHQNNSHPAPAAHSAPHMQSTHPESPRQQYQNQGRTAAPQYQNRAPQQYQNRPAQQYQPYRAPVGTQADRPVQNPYTPQAGARGVYPSSNYNTYGRQPSPGTAKQTYAPPGHLGAWLNTHRNVPVPQQQQMLRSDPSFRQLPQGEQQRVMNQLNQVNRLPDAQRERRLARAENLERLSPDDRARVAQSARRWTTMPQDRQAMMRNAFRDLKAVPPDQRSIVLNSSRYQGQFSPEERGILSDMLQVEPYAPPRQ
jgi:hypothetical protein